MAGQGGVRQGQPGKSYANRSDLNLNRADQPGASSQPAPQGSVNGASALTPDMIPTLDEPTQFPDEPVTAGLPFGEGPDSTSAVPDVANALVYAALRRHPDNPDLQRMVAYMNLRKNG